MLDTKKYRVFVWKKKVKKMAIPWFRDVVTVYSHTVEQPGTGS
jgi:hypothetical protein